jgi:hypothetical protein
VGKDILQWRTHHRPISGVLAAAQAPLRAEQLAQFVEIGKQYIADFLMDLQQFLDPVLSGQKQYRLYHQSVTDFLLDEEKAEEFWIDPVDVHKRIVSNYQNKALSCEEIDWRQIDDYGLLHLAYHMKKAGKKDELRKLLLNFKWMRTKLENVTVIHEKTGVKIPNVNSLIHDYDYLLDDTEIRLVQDAIKLSHYAILKDKTQLAGQLLGRLLCFHEDGIQSLLSQASGYRDGIRLLSELVL